MKTIKKIFGVANHIAKKLWEKNKHVIIKKAFQTLRKGRGEIGKRILNGVEGEFENYMKSNQSLKDYFRNVIHEQPNNKQQYNQRSHIADSIKSLFN